MTGLARQARTRSWRPRSATPAGWPVLPCIPGEKIPATRHGFHDATTDPDKVSWWWDRNPDRNVGIATGTPGPDVLDIDRHETGSGFAAYNKLIRAGITGKPMAVVRTPRGGIHAYYAGTEQGNGHVPAEHVDFRGKGGYVVAPPSQVGGRRYQVMQHEPSRDTFDWSRARELLDLQPERPAREPARGQDRPRDVTRLAGWVARQPEGNRNHGLFWAANRAAEAGDTDALDAIAKAAKDTGLDAREIDRTIRSAQRTSGDARPFGPASGRRWLT